MNFCYGNVSRFWLNIILILLSYTSVGQVDYSFKTYTSTEGLSNNWVQSICQDKTGFLWVATWDGLSRFDGYEFKNYDYNPEDSLSLPYFSLDKVVVDRFNEVLVMCQGKPISVYDRTLERFERFKINGTVFRVWDINIDNHNNTWILGSEGLYLSKGESHLFDKINLVDNHNNPFLLNTDKLLSIDNTGTVWIYKMEYPAGISICKGHQISESVIKMEAPIQLPLIGCKSYYMHNIDVLDFYQSKSGKTWMFSKYGLFLYNQDQNQFQRYSSHITPEEFTGKPYFTWLDETSGINIIDTQANSYFSIKTDPDKYFETVFIDQHKTIWSGTISPSKDNIGLNRYIKTPKYFKHYLTEKNEKNESNLVCSVLKDCYGDIWAGIRNSNYLIRIKPDREILKVKYAGQNVNDNYPVLQSMLPDSSGIWLGCTNNHLYHYEYRSNKFSSLLPSPLIYNGKPYNLKIHNILKRNNDIIINGSEGIYKFNLNSKKLELCYKFYGEGIGFTMSKDSIDGFWVGISSASLFHLNSALKQDSYFRIRDRQDIVEQICVGNDNDLWVALQGGGLCHLFRKDGKDEIYSSKDGLINNTVHSLLMDKTGKIWISSDKGISCFNPGTNKFRNFGLEEGLKIQEFNDDSYFQSPEGEMFFGGVGGLVSFYPDKMIEEVKDTWPLILTETNVSGTPRRFQKAIYEMDTLMLQKGDNNLRISFASLNFKDYLRTKYRYRLEGVTDSWRTTGPKNRDIAYYNLLPGSYKLEIQAAGKDGKWDSKKSIRVIIPFWFYETIWFKILLGLLVLAGVAVLVFSYIKNIEIRARRDQDELRMQVLRGQMNPHFIFNSLNSINYFISNNDKLSANKYIADFSRLIRSFLSNLSNDFVPMETEFQLLTDYLNLEHLRFGDKFNYSFDVSMIEDTTNYFVLSGIVQPFIENAIWHGMNGLEGRKGRIDIRFLLLNETLLQCVIEDDGIGRKIAKEYLHELPHKKSRGIGIVLERLQFYNVHKKGNYQITFSDLNKDKEETGTRVTIDLPLKKWVPNNGNSA